MIIACPDCGVLEDVPPLARHGTAFCARCQGALEVTALRSADAALACAVSILVLLIPVDTLPLLQVDLLGQQAESPLVAGIGELWHHGWILLAGVSVICVVVLPLARFALLGVVLAALRLGRRPAWLGRAFRWAMWLDDWAMLDVFLLSVGVGYYYLTNIEQVRASIEVGGYCLIAAGLLTMVARASLDERAVWRALGREFGADAPGGRSSPGDRTSPGARASPAGPMLGCRTCALAVPLSREHEPCPRCGARIRFRERDAAARTAACLAAALVLIFPANIYPMNVSSALGTQIGYTNLSFVEVLWQAGQWPLAVVTFWTSILTPGLQILALGWCVQSVWRGSGRHLVLKTKVLRMVAESERWSLSGPLTVMFFVPLIDFRPIGTEEAGWGATAFMVMVVLMMVASITFDPRLMWDSR